MRKKNPYIGRTLNQFIAEQRRKDPKFAATFDRLQLARKVRTLRNTRRLTQTQLATRAGTKQSVIARLESGRVAPKLDLLAKLAEAMDLWLSVDFTKKPPARVS